MAKACVKCGAANSFTKNVAFINIKGEEYCTKCADEYIAKAISGILITTTNNIDGYTVSKYIDIESVEIVVGTGVFSEFTGEVSDFLGSRSSAFEQKLQKAKQAALDTLRYKASEKGGNAVIGIDLDYTEFSGNRIGVVANGTIVVLTKV
ncbi:heavy metal-binding domain-containing protein [bacterium]|nr:heavy metal-binding domain-containing protein [bacterium]